MKALIQRVKRASVTVDDNVVGEIAAGLLILVGIRDSDTEKQMEFVADKCLNLRIFEDEAGKFNHSILETGGDVLVVSQFTLYGDTRKGRRPSFTDAARPEVSEPLYESFVNRIREQGVKTETGIFGAMMDVELVNDGPVTLMVEKD